MTEHIRALGSDVEVKESFVVLDAGDFMSWCELNATMNPGKAVKMYVSQIMRKYLPFYNLMYCDVRASFFLFTLKDTLSFPTKTDIPVLRRFPETKQ